MMVMISHLADVSALNCGRFQYGESAPFIMVEPQAPRLVTCAT
jgi:hypothetical protein